MKPPLSNISDFSTYRNVTATGSPMTNLDSSNWYARYWVNMTTANQSVTPRLTAFSLSYKAINGILTYTAIPIPFCYGLPSTRLAMRRPQRSTTSP